MRTIGFVLRKEFQQLSRDRRLLAVIFISPVLQIALLGYAANLDVRNVPLAVCDQDRSASSRELVGYFIQSGSFTFAVDAPSPEQAYSAIVQGKASMSLIIPHGYGHDLLSLRSPQVQLLSDGSDSQAAAIGMSYATIIVTHAANAFVQEQLSKMPAAFSPMSMQLHIEPEIRGLYNPGLLTRNYMVPGVLALIIMVITSVLSSLAIVKEKESGTLEQLLVSPITPFQLIVGKLLPFIIISLILILITLGSNFVLFGLWPRGNIFALLLLTLLFMLSTLGFGLFVSTIATTQQQAMMIATFFIMLPMMMLSGFVFPIENMPTIIQPITYIMPLRYYFEIIRGIYLKGIGLAELLPDIIALLVLGAALITASALRFKKRLG